MKYKGIELKEIAESHIENLPKKMLVWGTSDDEPSKRVVCATAIDNCGNLFFIARQALNCNGVVVWTHCAEIPDEPKLATFRELSRWLAEGKGEVMAGCKMVHASWAYDLDEENSAATQVLKVRKWEDVDWHTPTLEYLGLENK